MRTALSLAFAVSLCGAAGCGGSTPPAASVSSSTAHPIVTGAPDARFRDRRVEVARISTTSAALRLGMLDDAANGEELIDLPLTSKANDVRTLVVVAVYERYARVGATRAETDSEVRAAAAAFAKSDRPVALLRIDDSARLIDVVRAAREIRIAGIGVRVLGSVGPSEPPPSTAWAAGSCPFPLASDEHAVDDAVVKVTVDDNGEGRPGVVHVLESPALGFPWAAAICATFQQFEPSTAAAGSARFGKPLNIRFTR